MYVAITTVEVKPGSIPTVRDLFERTNPPLVAEQAEWREAKFTANFERNSVTVLAFWDSAEAYRTFSESDAFREVMSEFAPHFAGSPRVSVNEVLFEM